MNDLTQNNILIPLLAGTIIMGLFVAFIISFIFRYQKKQRQFQIEKEQFAHELLKTKIEIQEQTLSNISRELHDNLGQMASLIKIQLNLITVEPASDNERKVQEIKEILAELIQDIRTISTGLKSQNLERFGLFEMIKRDIIRFEKVSGLKIQLHIAEQSFDLNREKEIFLYRMSQEVFNNMIKHAQATEASLTIKNNTSSLDFVFKDNGKGFDPNTIHSGSGLINLKERSQIIDAEFNIKSKLDLGTEITISLNNQHERQN